MKFVLIALMALSQLAVAGPAQRVARRVRVGTDVFLTRQESLRPIPRWVLDQAQCVASLRVVKAGFIFGGEGSVGLVSCRTADGSWSAPSFMNLGGASVGLQIGGQVAESVLVFMTPFSRQILTRATFKMGVDLSIAAGPVGEGGAVDALPNAEVLTYSRAVGLFAGISLSGVVLGHAPALNREVYGGSRPADILATSGDQAPAIVAPYPDALSRY